MRVLFLSTCAFCSAAHLFVPVLFAVKELKPEAYSLLFVLSVVAIVPLATLLSHATSRQSSGGRAGERHRRRRREEARYKGSGFVDYLNASGDAVEFTVQAPAAGWYDLSFRFANGGSSDRAMTLTVNGQTVNGGVTFARTGSWTQWRSAVATVQLTEGVNTVRLAASGQSGPNLDSLTIRRSSRRPAARTRPSRRCPGA